MRSATASRHSKFFKVLLLGFAFRMCSLCVGLGYTCWGFFLSCVWHSSEVRSIKDSILASLDQLRRKSGAPTQPHSALNPSFKPESQKAPHASIPDWGRRLGVSQDSEMCSSLTSDLLSQPISLQKPFLETRLQILCNSGTKATLADGGNDP